MERAQRDLQATQSNLEQGFHEVAISRAYYAMFYAASALLASKGIARSKHSGVVSAFGEHFVKTGIFESTYAKMLGQAFDSRLDSDYDIVFTPEQALVEAIQQDAQRFVQRAEQYLQQTGAL
ncbi:MAG: HEPN domain-containing protein [Caldilineaceae bacterium]